MKGRNMKINSINTYNQSMKAKSNPNFGMAKWASAKNMQDFFEASIKDGNSINKIYTFLDLVNKDTAKNTIMNPRGMDNSRILLSMSNFSRTVLIGSVFEFYDACKFSQKVRNAENTLLEAVLIDEARKGKLTEAVEILRKELPELTEKIDSFAKNDTLQDINKYGKEL